MRQKLFLFFTLFFIFTGLAAQQNHIIKGVVKDGKTGVPLAFVNIVAGNSKTGTTTDIDGKFSIPVSDTTCCLKLTYVGYQTKKYRIDRSKKTQTVKMSQQPINLQEVTVLPGINPAHRIIDSVLRHKKENNPERIPAFTYTSYDKVILTADIDTALLFDTTVTDTLAIKARNLFKKHDFFILETVTERKYMYPDLNQENVLATKVSGFKDPVIVFMISQIQSTTFYDNQIKILDKNYVNPISKGSKKKYFFQIEDTTYTSRGDTVFVISYRPLLNTRFDGLKGFLYINTNHWAIQNVKAEPARDTSGIIIHIQQAYNLIDNHWFPVQLNTDIDFKVAVMSFGDTTVPLKAIGKSYIKDINLHPAIKKSDFGFHEVEIAPDATRKKGEFWARYRTDSLTQREKETYRVIDSLGKATNFDKIASVTTTLMSGYIPYRFIDIELDKFIRYNRYEGLYLGLGAHTNGLFSKTLTLGGFFGYGFGDKTSKFGINGSVKIHKKSETELFLSLYQKAIASGEVTFGEKGQRIWNTSDFFTFFIRRMNLTRGGDAMLAFRLKQLRDFKWFTGIKIQNKNAFDGYYFTGSNIDTLSSFRFREAVLGFRFSFREKTIQTTKGYISMGSKYPEVYLKYTHGFNNLLDGDFNYDRLDLRISQKIHLRYFGDFSYRLAAGVIFGTIPACNLFDVNGTFGSFTVYAPFSFGTMRPSEFLSDRYVALFLSHSFGNLLWKGKGIFNPQLMLVTNLAFGSLENKSVHHNYNFNTLEKGYYESGIIIRKLLDFQVYDIGLGVLYRYGPYGFDTPFDNFAFKFSLFYGF